MKKILLLCSLFAVCFSSCKEEDETPVALNPVIYSISPTQGPVKAIVTIRGKRFSADLSGNIVKFAGANAKVLLATDTLLKVEAPEDGGTGTITVTTNNRLSKGPVFSYGEVEQDYETTFYAGIARGNEIGTVAEAKFNNPEGVVFDSHGNLIVADRSNHTIKMITPDGVVSVVAGNGTAGNTDGAVDVARFNNPYKVGIDKNDNIYVADNSNHLVRKIDAVTKIVSTVAGARTATAGSSGFIDGPANTARFNSPIAIDVDMNGNIYVADNNNHAIRKISNGIVTTIAGNGASGYGDGVWPNVQFWNPSGVAVDNDGNVLVADRRNNRIRKVNVSSGVTTTIAGNGTAESIDGNGLKASFNQPFGIKITADGVIYVADLQSHSIRLMRPSGDVITLGGQGSAGDVDGEKIQSKFNQPTEVAVDAQGNVFVADLSNHKIRKISKVVTP